MDGGEGTVVERVRHELGSVLPKLGFSSPLHQLKLRKHGKDAFGIGNIKGSEHVESFKISMGRKNR